jgi:hypothetical protein
MLPALVASAALAMSAAPAGANGVVLHDTDHGYRMTVRVATKGFTLGLDHTYSGGSTVFELSCGKKRHGPRQFAAGFAPITPAKSFTGGLNDWNVKKRFCDLTKTVGDSIAPAGSFHLKASR